MDNCDRTLRDAIQPPPPPEGNSSLCFTVGPCGGHLLFKHVGSFISYIKGICLLRRIHTVTSFNQTYRTNQL